MTDYGLVGNSQMYIQKQPFVDVLQNSFLSFATDVFLSIFPNVLKRLFCRTSAKDCVCRYSTKQLILKFCFKSLASAYEKIMS